MPVLGMPVLAVLALAGCADPASPSRVDFLPGFYGGAVADEPRAALVARDILAAGGSAADAAVALYFALAVTKPAAAGLGAVGTCLVYQPDEKTVRAIDFAGADAAGASIAIPGAVRGMYAVHAMAGRLRWSQLLGPAEELARFGTVISGSFVRDIETRPEVAEDREFGPLLRRADGSLIGDGDRLMQPALAAFIGTIRVEGPAAFYDGALGQAFVDAVDRMGETLDLAALRAQVPRATDTLVRPAGNAEAHFVPSHQSAGPYQAELWRLLSDQRRLLRAGSGETSRMVADASARALSAYAGESASVAFTPEGTSFVVADRSGNAVACGVTLNRPFGIGRTAPGTGIFPAALPRPGEVSGALSPVIVANAHTDILVLAVSGSGAGGPVGTVQTGVLTALGGEPLQRAMDAPRPLGLVNAVFCPDGLPTNPGSCASAADRRGSGHAATPVPGRGRP